MTFANGQGTESIVDVAIQVLMGRRQVRVDGHVLNTPSAFLLGIDVMKQLGVTINFTTQMCYAQAMERTLRLHDMPEESKMQRWRQKALATEERRGKNRVLRMPGKSAVDRAACATAQGERSAQKARGSGLASFIGASAYGDADDSAFFSLSS